MTDYKCKHRTIFLTIRLGFCNKKRVLVDGWDNAVCRDCTEKEEEKVYTDSCACCPMCEEQATGTEDEYKCQIDGRKIYFPKLETCEKHPFTSQTSDWVRLF